MKFIFENDNKFTNKAPRKNLKESYDLKDAEVFMNTWENYNEYGADSGITPTGWMSIEDAIDYFEEYAEHEPFINDTDNIPKVFGIGEYSSVKDAEEPCQSCNAEE